MGSYVSQSDLTTRLGADLLVNLTNEDPDAVAVDTSAMNEAIDDAEAEVNGYVGAQYALPFTAPFPRLVVSIARRVTIFHLYQLQPGMVPESVEADYTRAIEQLEKIAAGKISLGLKTDGTDATASAESGRVAIRRGGNDRRYSRSNFEGF